MPSLLQKIKHRLGKLRESSESRYPYKWKNPEFDVLFKIHNEIEEFRLRHWGDEKEYVMRMMQSLSNYDVFFDIGSSVGLNSILAAKVLTKGQVVSFEPDPENTSRLRENYKINGLKNFSVFQIAVGASRDKLALYTVGSNGFSPSLKKVNGIDSTIQVDVESIDNLVSQRKIPIPTVIKIDIEGAEFEALKGMETLLRQDTRPRHIFLELHPDFLPSFGTDVSEIMNYLGSLPYDIHDNIQRDKQILLKLQSK